MLVCVYMKLMAPCRLSLVNFHPIIMAKYCSIRWAFTSLLILYYVNLVITFMGPYFHQIVVEYMNAKEINGDVYHSAEVFKMNYEEMEREFKIYVYPDGDEHTYYHTPRSISGKYASEGYFFKNIRESTFVTNDPDQAHLFFIPISCHKMHQKISSYEDMASTVKEYVEGLVLKYPYWNRTLGANHFFVTCHEIDVRATESVPLLVKNSIRVVCSPSYRTGFIPHKDVSLPSITQPFSDFGGKGTCKRTILGYWAGVRNSDVRQRLVKFWGKDDVLDIQKNRVYYKAAGKMDKFHCSKFCICPVGSRVSSNRITMAIHYGCVPVIMADYFELPFNDILDWQKFSVILNERDALQLKIILQIKSYKDYKMLHSNLLKVQRHFQWNTPPVKYDAFHTVLYELWLRRNVIRF